MHKKKEVQFSYAFSSPLTRAHQTAKITLEQIQTPKITVLEHLTPESNPQHLFEELHHYSSDSRILIVTHEPFASTCISTLISGSEQSRIVMKTTSMACVKIDGHAGRGTGRLLWLLTSDIMKQVLR